MTQQTLSRSEGQALLEKPRRHKYRASPIMVDGIRFASKREGNHWCWLRLREKAGEIINLKRQVPFDLHAISGDKVARIVMDFTYNDPVSGELIVEDSKGFRTSLYKLKKRFFEAQYKTPIIEV